MHRLLSRVLVTKLLSFVYKYYSNSIGFCVSVKNSQFEGGGGYVDVVIYRI